jgi:6,7-dimethyl-8-ribityllumazine synthase
MRADSLASSMVALGLVVAQFNRPITERMEETAERAAAEADATIVGTVHVPGTYDAPLSADRLARRSDVEAVAVLGAIIEGDTDHDEVIGHAVAKSLTEISLDRDTPVTFGVTGPGMTAEEARERVDKGREAVESAIDLVETHR